MKTEVQKTELYQQFKKALGINDMRTDDNPYIVECCKIAENYAKLRLSAVSGMLPLTKEHQCIERGHAFYLVCEIDNGRSKYGEHKCSRCGHVEPFQYDYGSC